MFRVLLPFSGTLLLLAWLSLAARADEPSDLLMPEEVEPQLYATGFELSEGPALDAGGNLYVPNYRGNGNIGRITTKGVASVFCRLDALFPEENRRPQANGLKIDSEGRLIAADVGCGRLLRITASGESAEVLADRWQGVPFHSVDDVALDLTGNIFFTDPGPSSLDNPVGVVYRYDINTKKVSQLMTGLAYPNGIAVTPSQKQLCVSETLKHRILICDLGEDGSVTTSRTLIEFPDEPAATDGTEPGRPEGMVFDTRGRMFVAMGNTNTINVVDVDSGQLIQRYAAGGSGVTNCHFHGLFLYVTVADSEAVFRLKLGVRGFAYASP